MKTDKSIYFPCFDINPGQKTIKLDSGFFSVHYPICSWQVQRIWLYGPFSSRAGALADHNRFHDS